jgi:hypothetical protein
MAGKIRNARARHEAAHAVVARKFGLHVVCVDARVDEPNVTRASAAYSASDDVAAQITGHEQDAIVSLAGRAANRQEHADLRVFDLFTEHHDADTRIACSAIYNMVCLMSGQPVPQGPEQISVSIDDAMQEQMYDIYFRLLRDTAALVERHWPAIERVAKHLERRGRINDQNQLDELIERGERVSQ